MSFNGSSPHHLTFELRDVRSLFWRLKSELKEVCLWENRKGNVLSYIGKRIERRGLSVKEEERREKRRRLVILRILGTRES